MKQNIIIEIFIINYSKYIIKIAFNYLLKIFILWAKQIHLT